MNDRAYPSFCRPCGRTHTVVASFMSADSIVIEGRDYLTVAHPACAEYMGDLFTHMVSRNPGLARPDGRHVRHPFLSAPR